MVITILHNHILYIYIYVYTIYIWNILNYPISLSYIQIDISYMDINRYILSMIQIPSHTYTYLVGAFKTFETYEFVNWDDDSNPILMGK